MNEATFLLLTFLPGAGFKRIPGVAEKPNTGVLKPDFHG